MSSTIERPATNSKYIGRFAPSPTGPLHFGSLVSALASYLDARAANGFWQVRIDDIDPPREIKGSDSIILESLEIMGLFWDGAVLYQSQRLDAYVDTLAKLEELELTYPCTCSRRQYGHFYPGTCRNRLFESTAAEYSTRIAVHHSVMFLDRLYGEQSALPGNAIGDFIVRRKDGLVSYQLATALDDAYQQISHVVRGADLINSTLQQIYLLDCLGLKPPLYCHTPLIVDSRGDKLSKQSGARPIDTSRPAEVLLLALQALNQHPPAELADCSCRQILDWAVAHFNLQAIGTANTLDTSAQC